MTSQHRATPEQWATAEYYGNPRKEPCPHGEYACILELRARVEALEATQHAHADTLRLSEEERQQLLGELSKPAKLEQFTNPPIGEPWLPMPLVKRVANAMDSVPSDSEAEARAAIREVAAWLRSEYPKREGYGTAWANLIEEEANR